MKSIDYPEPWTLFQENPPSEQPGGLRIVPNIGNIQFMEQKPDKIALRPKRSRRHKLDWAETYQQMAQSGEDWSDWEALPEGLNAIPGEAGK